MFSPYHTATFEAPYTLSSYPTPRVGDYHRTNVSSGIPYSGSSSSIDQSTSEPIHGYHQQDSRLVLPNWLYVCDQYPLEADTAVIISHSLINNLSTSTHTE